MTQGDVSFAEWRQTLLTVWMPWVRQEALPKIEGSGRVDSGVQVQTDEAVFGMALGQTNVQIAVPVDQDPNRCTLRGHTTVLVSGPEKSCSVVVFWYYTQVRVWWNCPWWKIICNFSGMLLESAVWVCSYIMWPLLCEYVAILCSMYLSVRTHTYRNICPY